MSDPKKPSASGMWMIALVVAGLIFGALTSYWADFWVYQDGRQISATISAEKSHGVLEYEYVGNGVHYFGQGQKGRNLKGDAQVGQQVLIWASTSHPKFSSPEMPLFSVVRALVVLAVLVVVEIFALISLVRMHRPAKKPLPTAASVDRSVPK